MTLECPAAAPRPAIHVIGGVCVDLIMGPVPPWPRPGTETFVPHSELRAGGPAGNTALALKALDVPHRIVCTIGDDMFGAWLAETFGETAQSWRKVERPTAISIGIEHPGGERSFLTSAGNLVDETVGGILETMPLRAVPGDIALVTGAFLYSHLIGSLDSLLAELAERGFAVALDTGWPPGGWTAKTLERTVGWFAHCDHILLNEIESLSLSGATSVERAAAWMADRAKPGAAVVVKRGAEGASGWRAGQVRQAPAPKVPVVDTTGAGDAFNAGYLAACLSGARLGEALLQGVAIASAAIASSPRRYRAPDLETMSVEKEGG